MRAVYFNPQGRPGQVLSVEIRRMVQQALLAQVGCYFSNALF
jgi:hypothetical protein